MGPAAGFIVEADSAGTVRGYLLQDPIPVDNPLTSWDLAPFFGPGTLSVTRFPEGRAEPITGTVEIKHRNIAADLTEYFLASEQVKTAFNTSIQMDKEGRVIGAGGLFLQVLPSDGLSNEEPAEEIMDAVERALAASPSLGSWFAEGGTREDLIHGLFREFTPVIALERDIRFECPCTREKYGDFLLRLDESEFDDMMLNGADPVEIYCHNCGSRYQYPKEELQSAKKAKTEKTE
jgi:molecular chaperone Hsp33